MSLTLIAILFIGLMIGAAFGFFASKKSDVYRNLYDKLLADYQQKEKKLAEISTDITRYETQLELTQEENDAFRTNEKEIQSKLTQFQGKISSLEAEQKFYLKQRTDNLAEIESLTAQKNNLEQHKSDLEVRLSTTIHDNQGLQKKLTEQNQEFVRLQKMSEQTFENLAHKIFNEKAQSFTQKSEKTLQDALAPVKESFGLFQSLVTEKFTTQEKQQYVLKEELKRIIDVNEKMTFQADSLTKALKGDNKVMGNWGEMLLERILEDSGLTKNIDYVLQASGYDLKDEAGKRQIPDVIVKLPDHKEIIIDAKVSLLDYERYLSDPDNRIMHEKAFLKSIRCHIDGLAAKKYYQNDKLLSPDFVLMFMPIEGAYNLAMQLDPQLHHYAWNKRIAIVTNTTLFATLRTVSSLWRIEKQNKNAEKIASRAGLIYDKFCGFFKDIEMIDRKFNETHKLFDEAVKKLDTGKGSLIGQVETLKQLGAKTSKSLPKEYISDEVLEEG